MLKLVHLLRSMDYEDAELGPVVFQQLHEIIGQFPFQAPTVFNFYLADYELPMPAMPEPEPEAEPEAEPEPESEPESQPLTAPEFQIFTPPYFVGYLNGMASVIKNGVSYHCNAARSLGISARELDEGRSREICPQGELSWEGSGAK